MGKLQDDCYELKQHDGVAEREIHTHTHTHRVRCGGGGGGQTGVAARNGLRTHTDLYAMAIVTVVSRSRRPPLSFARMTLFDVYGMYDVGVTLVTTGNTCWTGVGPSFAPGFASSVARRRR